MSAEPQPAPDFLLEDQSILSQIKESFAPDGAAEREHNARPDSAGFGSIHYSLITNLRPERVLAIGSRHGYVPSIIALALKANGAGKLDLSTPTTAIQRTASMSRLAALRTGQVIRRRSSRVLGCAT